MVHLGLGAFHRAHQAWYTDRADDGWGIAAFTGRSPEAARTLAAQDGLYVLLSRGVDGDRAEVVESIVAAYDGADAAAWRAAVADPDVGVVTLTVTEFLILQALATRPGVVKSRNALMDAAYDDQVYVDDRTIDSHIKRLRKKFKAADDAFDMIETLYGVGYRFKEA